MSLLPFCQCKVRQLFQELITFADDKPPTEAASNLTRAGSSSSLSESSSDTTSSDSDSSDSDLTP